MNELKRRASVRFITGGQVMFHTGSPESFGDLVNLGRHGMLVRTNVRVPQGTLLRIGITVEGYPTPLQGDGSIVGFKQDLLAVKFLSEPAGLTRLLSWLSQENVPWTGVDTLHSDQVTLSLVPEQGEPSASSPKTIDPELEAILPLIDAMG
jgi:hypothetical protein